MLSLDAMRDVFVFHPIERTKAWWRNEVLRNELRGMSAPVLEAVCRDTGFGVGEIDHLVADHPGPGRLMPQRLRLAGLDTAELAVEQPAMLREMSRTCAKCQSWRRCERDLRYADIKPLRWDYCLNNGNIDLLNEVGRKD